MTSYIRVDKDLHVRIYRVTLGCKGRYRKRNGQEISMVSDFSMIHMALFNEHVLRTLFGLNNGRRSSFMVII